MKVLIDTHFVLWLLFNPEKLSAEEISILEKPENTIICSAISLMEISLKYSLGKLHLEGVQPDEIPGILSANAYQLEDLEPAIAASFHLLPQGIHRDPFDRMLIWHSISKNYRFLSRDQKIEKYKDHGLILA